MQVSRWGNSWPSGSLPMSWRPWASEKAMT